MTILRSRLILQFIPKFSPKLNLYLMSPLMSLSAIFKQVIFINLHYIDAKKNGARFYVSIDKLLNGLFC